jgi:hypothetical protein
MEEQQRIACQALDRDVHDVPRASQTCVGVPNGSLRLQPASPKPVIREPEPRAAMVVLSVVDPNRTPSRQHRAVSWHPVWGAGEQFRQVQGRVRIVPDAEEKYLAVQVQDPANGAVRAVWREGEWAGGHTCRFGPRRRERLAVAAPLDAGLAPEQIRHDPQIG